MLSATLPAEFQSAAASPVLDSNFKKMLGRSHCITGLNSIEPRYDISSDIAAFDALKTDWDQLSQSGNAIAIITARTNDRPRLVCPMLLR